MVQPCPVPRRSDFHQGGGRRADAARCPSGLPTIAVVSRSRMNRRRSCRHHHELGLGGAVEELLPRVRPRRGCCLHRPRSATCLPVRERPHVHFAAPDSSEYVRDPPAVGENIGESSARTCPAYRGMAVAFPGFQPEASSPSIGRIISLFGGLRDVFDEREKLPGRMPGGGHWLFALSVRRCVWPVPSADCQYKLDAPLPRFAVKTIRRPSGVQIGFSLARRART